MESHANTARRTLNGGSSGEPTLTIEAASAGVWGTRLRVGIDTMTSDSLRYFNLVVCEVVTVSGREQVVNSTTYHNLSMDQSDSRYAPSVVNNDGSALVHLIDESLGELPTLTHADVIGDPGSGTFLSLDHGDDGDEPGTAGWDAAAPGKIPGSPATKTGMYALDTIAPNIFNLLCVPAAALLPAPAMQSIYARANL